MFAEEVCWNGTVRTSILKMKLKGFPEMLVLIYQLQEFISKRNINISVSTKLRDVSIEMGLREQNVKNLHHLFKK